MALERCLFIKQGLHCCRFIGNLVSSAAGSGASGSPSVFSVISSVSTRNAERTGACGSGIFIAEEVDGIEDKGLGDTTNQCKDTLGGLVVHAPQI